MSLVDKYCPPHISTNFDVLTHGEDLMYCILNQTNIQDNNNKFFIMQLLKNNSTESFCFYTRGGRVGYSGHISCELYISFDNALQDWNKKFLEKTGMNWRERLETIADSTKYQYIEMKFHEESSPIPTVTEDSQLPSEIVQLIARIWDPALYDETMQQLNVDKKKLPLGKLSQSQINKAYHVISLLSTNLNDPQMVNKLSSQFYSLIPYNCGMKSPPLICNESIIEERLDQLKSLDEITASAEQLAHTNYNDLDKCYLSLNCQIALETNPDIIQMIVKYVKNTSSTYHNFNLTVKNIFSLHKSEEKLNFTPYESNANRQLLWHGSREANYVGILSKGLRINVENVVKTGSMFGNGVYFSNSVSKSARYTHTTNKKRGALLLLCEVALGESHPLTNATYITTLPPGKMSTWGQGQLSPDPSDTYTLENGCIVPYGQLINSKPGLTLLHDEYIVYNTDQIKIKYLVEVDIK